jgi:hypothetical protein
MAGCMRTALCLLLLCASPALAQRVEVRGRGDAATDAFLRSYVEAGRYTLIARDTTIGRADTVRGDALVLRATLRLDGVITGDLVIVDANVFLRPAAQVLGSVRNIGGGYYPSELASVGGSVESEPNAPYLVRQRDDGTVEILGTTRPSGIVLPGIFGLAPPSYDRVDGLTLSASAGLLLPRMGAAEPMVVGRADYRSQRGALTGGAQLVVPGQRTTLSAGAERTTLTNERWIRGDLDNSLSYLFQAKDYRDYYEADRAWVELSRTVGPDDRSITPFVRAQVEDARTLPARSPWTVFGTPRADNIVVDDGRTTSAIGGMRLDWTLPRHVVRLQGAVEAAFSALEADHDFNAYVVDIDWAMAALWTHTLRIQSRLQGPLPGTDSLPRQRWSFVGGPGTLYTFDFADFRGDRVAFVETLYSIPIERARLPVIGPPDLDLLHLAGMAWTAAERRSFEQNVGVRLRFSLFNVRVLTNPTAFTDDVEFSIGLNLPRRRYPWQPEREPPL